MDNVYYTDPELQPYFDKADRWDVDVRKWKFRALVSIPLLFSFCMLLVSGGVVYALLDLSVALKTAQHNPPWVMQAHEEPKRLTVLDRNVYDLIRRDEATISGKLADYIYWYETWDGRAHKDAREHQRSMLAMHTASGTDIIRLYTERKAEDAKLGKNAFIQVKIREIKRQSDNLWEVEYTRVFRGTRGAKQKHYSAQIAFSFTPTPLSFQDRWRNEHGFLAQRFVRTETL